MKLTTYLNFSGDCRAAFEFYEKCLGGKLSAMMTNGDSPMAGQMPAEWKDKILHTHLLVGNEALMGSDAPPDQYDTPQGFSVAIGLTDPKEAERVFNALVAGGKVRVPLQETFWALRFGELVDKFGISWMGNCGQPPKSQ